MFDCPIPLPSSTHYDTLGVRPEATAEELRDAMTELSASLRALQKAASRDVTAHYAIERDGSFTIDVALFEAE